jgi:hypothetical protein
VLLRDTAFFREFALPVLVARDLREAVARRWQRILSASNLPGVAARARDLAGRLGGDAGLVGAAAWLHDIGYAAPLVVTNFHPLDGAPYLQDSAKPDVVVQELFAHHTGALVEADERGLRAELVAEILRRHPPGDVVHRAMSRSGPEMISRVARFGRAESHSAEVLRAWAPAPAAARGRGGPSVLALGA